MVRTRRHTAAVHGMLIGNVFEHPTVLEFVGNNKYLQMAVSKVVARAYASKFGALTSKYLSRAAALDGYLPLLLWAKDIGCSWDKVIFINAGCRGHTEIMQYLYDNGGIIPAGTEAFACATKARSLKALEWLYQNNFDWNTDTCMVASTVNWLEGLKWLREHGCMWDSRVRLMAAGLGHLDVLKYAHLKDCPGSLVDPASAAAATGQLDVLRWMLEVGCAFDSGHCACAASGNQLETLQWLRSNNVPWSGAVLHYARNGGHSVLETWAMENGAPEPDGNELPEMLL